jgi:hypothetical protein
MARSSARRGRPRAVAGGLALGLALAAAHVEAEPYRLRGSALAQAQSPAGLLVLSSDGEVRPWLSAEAVVGAGAGDDATADVLVVAVHARDRARRREAMLGRFLVSPGALRPVHLDGAAARIGLPWQGSVEVFGGMPVVPRFGPRAYDWLVGTRVSRAIGDWGSAGVAYAHRRDHGSLAGEELGFDVAGAPGERVDVAARVAYDLVNPGVSELHVSSGLRRGDFRGELFALHRSPARILPATSLFSVLGDVPSRLVGSHVRWRAAPRLDVSGQAGARAIGGELGADLALRALLRTDDRGAGAVSLELRRQSAPDGGWTGARAAARVPLDARLSLATELELVVPDEARGRGAVWPWALAALRWRLAPRWETAAALEASASGEHTYRVDALVRVSHEWEVGR